ncbi:phage gene 29 protein family protein [Nocardia tengchongensis]
MTSLPDAIPWQPEILAPQRQDSLRRSESIDRNSNPIPQLPVHPHDGDPELAAAPLLGWVPFNGNPMWIPPELAAAISRHLYHQGFRLTGSVRADVSRRRGWWPW